MILFESEGLESKLSQSIQNLLFLNLVHCLGRTDLIIKLSKHLNFI